MLIERIQEGGNSATSIMAATQKNGEWHAHQHAEMIVTRIVPDSLAAREEILNFTHSAMGILKGIVKTENYDDAKKAFDLLLGELLTISLRLNHLAAETNVERAEINHALAEANVKMSRLQARLAEKAKQVKDLEGTVRDTAIRTAVTWLFGPVVKGIDELISLVDKGESTEAYLAHSIEDLQRLRQDIKNGESAMASLSQLRHTCEQVADAMQNIANALAMAIGHMQNARDDFAQQTELDLFVQTALLDLENLQSDVT